MRELTYSQAGIEAVAEEMRREPKVFYMQPVLQKLLLKGSIVVKKAYCDWDRYKEFKATMHEAAFELIEIPHARQSGKNSADIRMSCSHCHRGSAPSRIRTRLSSTICCSRRHRRRC